MKYLIAALILLCAGCMDSTRDTTKAQTENKQTDDHATTVTTKHTVGTSAGVPVDLTETTTVEHKAERQETGAIHSEEHTKETMEAPPWATALLTALGTKAAGIASGGWSGVAQTLGSFLTPDTAVGLASVAMGGTAVHMYHKRKKPKLEKKEPPANS